MQQIKDISVFKLQNSKKTIKSALMGLYGVNNKGLSKIILMNGCLNTKISNSSNLFFDNVKQQTTYLNNIEKNKIADNVKKKSRIKNYVGMRHILKLPVRGQRTHTNSSTARRKLTKINK